MFTSKIGTPSESHPFPETAKRFYERYRMGNRPFQAWFNGYAEITARCSNNNMHAYGLYLGVKDGLVERIGYTKGAGKAKNAPSSEEVHASVAVFCAYAKGRSLAELENLDLPSMLGHFGAWEGSSSQAVSALVKARKEDLPALKGNIPDLVYCLCLGGGLPFILLQWAILNHHIKSVLGEILGSDASGYIRFMDVAQVQAVVEALGRHPTLSLLGRAVEIGVRALHRNTVDDSSLRAAYQRHSFQSLAESASAHGFQILDQFQLAG